MNLKKYRSRGETIVEILAAMTILTLIITSVYSILLRASKTNTSVKNRVIALNYAREGLEGVRNIRDTNWLRYSGDRRNKWLCRDAFYEYGTGYPSVCTSGPGAAFSISNPIDNTYLYQSYKIQQNNCAAFIVDGYYILERVQDSNVYGTDFTSCNQGSVTTQYVLEPKMSISSTVPQLEAAREEFRLYYDENNGGIVRHASHFYNGGLQSSVATPFYRRIKIDIVSPFEDPDGGTDLDDTAGTNLCTGNCDEAKMSITSVVEWQEDGNWEFVELEGQLFDFYERSDY